jgi:hypothetical protein
MVMDSCEKIRDGLEKAYKKLIEYKKYKKTPIIVLKEGKIIEIPPEKIVVPKTVYK